MSFPRLSAGWMTCALLGTEAANAGRLFERARRLLRPTAESRLGSFGNPGNGRYREELRKVLSAIGQYLMAHQLSQPHTLLRLDGQYGTGAVLTDVAGFAFVTRGKEYSVLDHPLVQARLHLPPDQFQQREDKPDGPQPLRLPTDPGGTRWRALPCGGGHPPRHEKEESGWRHAWRCRLRTLLHRAFRNRHSPPPMSSNCIC